jgi:hypothetical protein
VTEEDPKASVMVDDILGEIRTGLLVITRLRVNRNVNPLGALYVVFDAMCNNEIRVI